MRRSLAVLVLIMTLLACVSPLNDTFDSEVPAAAEAPIVQDYLEWLHTPKLAGPCANVPVVKLSWIRPEGVVGTRPVLWVKADGQLGAILGLSRSQIRSVGRIVTAQPVLMLRDVSIFQLCRPSVGF